jgi:mono/diheme cytochrome c family protein
MNLQNIISATALLALVLVGTNVLAADAQPGKAVYDKHCASCHGNDGKGNPAIAKALGEKGLNLTSKEATQKSDEQLMKVVAEGEGKMPAFKSLSQDEQKQVVTYIRSLGK